MNMNDTYLISTIVAANAVLLAVAAYLSKRMVQHFLDRSRAEFLESVKKRNAHDLELMKNALLIAAKESEIRTSWLHRRRSEALEELFNRVLILKNRTQDLAGARIGCPTDPKEIRPYTRETWELLHELMDDLDRKRIFLSESTCEKVRAIFYAAQDPITKYLTYIGVYDDEELESLGDVRESMSDDVYKTLVPAVELLVDECRQIYEVE
jgi:hypothetical protein